MLRRGWIVLVCACVWCRMPVDAVAQAGGEEILRRLEQANPGLSDYRAQLDVSVDLERLRVPSMRVTMYFRAPDKIRFSSENFALLPKESMSLGPSQLRSRFDIVSTEDTAEGTLKLSRIDLKRKSDKTGLQRIRVFVDNERWLIHRIVSPQPDGRLVTAEFRHTKVKEFLLPSELTVWFSSDSPDTSTVAPLDQFGLFRLAQLPRRGKITIRYSDYSINAGIDDAVFENNNGEK